MPDSVLFDQLHVTCFRPDPLNEAVTTQPARPSRNPSSLTRSTAVRQILDANPALTILDVIVSW